MKGWIEKCKAARGECTRDRLCLKYRMDGVASAKKVPGL